MTDSTPLSPAAQAVLDAYWDDVPLEAGAKCGLAAALRAAAGQMAAWADEDGRVDLADIFAIAAELDDTNSLEPNDLSHLS